MYSRSSRTLTLSPDSLQQEDRPQRRLHPQVAPPVPAVPHQVHIRAVDGALGRAAPVRGSDRGRLPAPDRRARRHQQEQHAADEARVRRAQQQRQRWDVKMNADTDGSVMLLTRSALFLCQQKYIVQTRGSTYGVNT